MSKQPDEVSAGEMVTSAAEIAELIQARRAHPPRVRWSDDGGEGLEDLSEPLWSGAHNPELRIEVLGEIVMAHIPQLARSDDGTIPLLPVMDLRTGEYGRLIVPAVLQSILEGMQDGYIGRKLLICTGEVVEGKNYRSVHVFAIHTKE